MKKYINNEKSGLPMTEERFLKYISSVKWQFAKTMKSIPHCYTIRGWDMQKEQEFVDFVYYIRENGIEDYFYKRKFIYLFLDGYKYWTMGDPLETTWVINRSKIDT